MLPCCIYNTYNSTQLHIFCVLSHSRPRPSFSLAHSSTLCAFSGASKRILYVKVEKAPVTLSISILIFLLCSPFLYPEKKWEKKKDKRERTKIKKKRFFVAAARLLHIVLSPKVTLCTALDFFFQRNVSATQWCVRKNYERMVSHKHEGERKNEHFSSWILLLTRFFSFILLHTDNSSCRCWYIIVVAFA